MDKNKWFEAQFRHIRIPDNMDTVGLEMFAEVKGIPHIDLGTAHKISVSKKDEKLKSKSNERWSGAGDRGRRPKDFWVRSCALLRLDLMRMVLEFIVRGSCLATTWTDVRIQR